MTTDDDDEPYDLRRHLKDTSKPAAENDSGNAHGNRRVPVIPVPVPFPEEPPGRGWSLRKKGKKQKLFLVLSPRPGPDGPNASGWYTRLREPISPLSLLNCDQL